jgi:Ni,Fe-hydrogenase I large subunit
MARITIDPVTRAGGHLRIEADVAGGSVTGAWVSATMFRDLESVLRGRDARDAWLLADRICGTCSGVHALASVRAVEQALGIVIPPNARMIRNVLAGTQLVRDHVLGLYQRQGPDWVDARAALSADPAATSQLARAQSQWPKSGVSYFAGVRDRLAAVIDSDQPGLFANGPWGHPAYRLSPEQNLLLLAHLLEALDWQRSLMRIHALLGGKDPHPQTYLVGGMALAPPWGGPTPPVTREHPQVPDRDAPIALSEAGITLVAGLITEAQDFVEQVFVPDVRLLAAAYPEWGALGMAGGDFLAWGDYPEKDGADAALFLPRGRLAGGNVNLSMEADPNSVAETVAHAWFADAAGAPALRRPGEGETTPAWSGIALPLTTLEGADKYSWIKAARYDGRPTETGPLARMLVGAANGQPEIRQALERMLADTGLTLAILPSVLGRMLARAVEAQVVVRQTGSWLAELKANLATGDVAVADITRWDQSSWPSEAEGHSIGEGPRGAVGHWVRIKGGVIDAYQVVDGGTWNASPRDATGDPGPLEAALVGIPVADPARPIEIQRVVHAFAPCAACAAHLVDPRDTGPLEIRVRAGEGTR